MVHHCKYPLFYLYLGVKISQNDAQYPHQVTYAPAKFEVAISNGLGYAFTRKYITQNVAQYPLHHTTYASTKFEVATSNSLGGDASTRKYII